MRKNVDSDKFKLEGETKRNQKIKWRKWGKNTEDNKEKAFG